jgi:hypothetical protein
MALRFDVVKEKGENLVADSGFSHRPEVGILAVQRGVCCPRVNTDDRRRLTVFLSERLLRDFRPQDGTFTPPHEPISNIERLPRSEQILCISCLMNGARVGES